VSNGTFNGGIPTGTAGALKTDTDLDGGLIGGTIGCNYDFGGFVLGIEADDSWSGKKGNSRLVAPAFNTNFQENVSERWLATVRGRVGYAFGPALIYATGGGAWAGVRIHEFNTLNTAVTATEDHTLSGWTFGGGAEWGFAPGWSAKVEYLHVDLRGNNTFFANTTCCTSQNVELRNDIVRAGINFRFGGFGGGGPVYARY
jgi:outer membrane immunogenic protein